MRYHLLVRSRVRQANRGDGLFVEVLVFSVFRQSDLILISCSWAITSETLSGNGCASIHERIEFGSTRSESAVQFKSLCLLQLHWLFDQLTGTDIAIRRGQS